MNFVIRHFTRLEEVQLRDRVKNLIERCGNEFVPPLSERTSTTQQDFRESIKDANHSYYEMLLDQPVFIALENHNVAGFMSYAPNQVHKHLSGYNPSNYVSTIIIAPSFRRYGVARLLYEAIIGESGSSAVTTRTWSTNYPHIYLLEKMGFRLAEKLMNDRGPGVHTVYYGRKSDPGKQR